jgi:hypothetical protein
MWWRRLRYVIILVGLCAIATCPAAKRACTRTSESREADDLLDYLAGRVAAIVAVTGKVPPLPAGPTPSPSCCEQGGVCAPDPTIWATPGWQQLGFSIDGDYRYAYQYAPDASGTSAIVRAVGDLDCDGHGTTTELKLTVEGTKVRRVESFTAESPDGDN